MTNSEFELILINGLVHTPETRIDFYLNEAFKNNIEPINFYLGLSKAYERLYKYVTSTDYVAWTENEKGEKSYIKNDLNLFQFTGGKLRGIISEENITEFLPYLYKMGKAIKTNIEKKDKPPKQIKGFQSTLTDTQISSLYEQMQDYFRGNFESFTAIFKPLSVIENFEKVIWLKRKTYLREFFTLLDIIPTQKIVNGLISDEKGKNIILPKQKKNEYSKYYSEMETIVNTIKKPTLKNLSI